MSVENKSDGLYLYVGDNTFWKLHFTDNSHFFFVEQQMDLNFIIDAAKKVTGFTINKEMAKKIE